MVEKLVVGGESATHQQLQNRGVWHRVTDADVDPLRDGAFSPEEGHYLVLVQVPRWLASLIRWIHGLIRAERVVGGLVQEHPEPSLGGQGIREELLAE